MDETTVVRYLRRYAGSLPYSDETVQRLVERFESLPDVPQPLLPAVARYPLRIVFCMMPDVALSPELMCSMAGIELEEQEVMQAVHAAGPFSGEAGAGAVSRLILAVEKGIHPRTAARVMLIDDDDFLALDDLLDLQERWEERVVQGLAYTSRRGLGRWRLAAGVLGTLNPFEIRRWLRRAAEMRRDPLGDS